MKINMRIGIAYSKRMQMEILSYVIRRGVGLVKALGQKGVGCEPWSCAAENALLLFANQIQHVEFEI